MSNKQKQPDTTFEDLLTPESKAKFDEKDAKSRKWIEDSRHPEFFKKSSQSKVNQHEFVSDERVEQDRDAINKIFDSQWTCERELETIEELIEISIVEVD